MNDFGGIDPPAGLINPDYKQQPGNSRKCIECGKNHDTIVEDMRTGERIKEIDKCKDCLFKNCFVPVRLHYDPPPRTEENYRRMVESLKKAEKLLMDQCHNRVLPSDTNVKT